MLQGEGIAKAAISAGLVDSFVAAAVYQANTHVLAWPTVLTDKLDYSHAC